MLLQIKSVNHEKFLPQACLCVVYRLFMGTSAVVRVDSRTHLLQKGLPKQKPIDGVKQILLVASGKGGVGKSTIAVNLAVALKNLEPHKNVGLLDADVFGPSVPLMMNLHDTPRLTDDNLMRPLVNYGVKCLSMGNLITEKSAAIWRGLMVMNAVDKLLRHVAWGPLDYMIIDTPPGTGDIHLSLVQNIPITGAVIISTAQKASLQVARRGITMFEKLKIPVVGIIQNMSSIRCQNCSQHTTIFGNHIVEFSKSIGIEILESIPLDLSIMEASDVGIPIIVSAPSSPQAQIFQNAASKVSRFLNLKSAAST